MKYGIGLDCGIASVGYAVMQLDENDDPCRIIRLGSRVFNKAENPQDGASLAAPRREARGMRRRIRRHQHRLERIRYLLVSSGVLSKTELDNLFCGQLCDIYMLRAKALDEPLTAAEFSRVLIHLAQRRGFRSNRKTDAQDKEAGKILSAVSETRKKWNAAAIEPSVKCFIRTRNSGNTNATKAMIMPPRWRGAWLKTKCTKFLKRKGASACRLQVKL